VVLITKVMDDLTRIGSDRPHFHQPFSFICAVRLIDNEGDAQQFGAFNKQLLESRSTL